ncbi:putative amidotransferase-domain-containing protein [Dendryphion nanum]|uniref:Amidotransferase-domain-containing protein n=1 Tax=Dendryphion nanum TaxID=256645 RepID=A0A9P9DUS3_9PLEO|nr:putative amidotransferase-domain-containing protein [Dendryphion nanum]
MPSTPRGYTHFPSQADLFYFCTTSSTSEEDLDIHYAPPSKSSLKIGVLVLSHEQLQLLDLAVVDLLSMISRNRMSRLNASGNAMNEAVDEIDIRYISETGGSFPVTSGSRMPVTNSLEDAPQFDILIVPGTFSSSSEIPMSVSTFLTNQASNNNLIAILSISSGILTLAQTGLLHQKRATGPSSLFSTLQQRYPETSWQQAPWTRHEKIWSSSSALSAMEMLTTLMREYFWDRSEAVECALSAAGIPRLELYE